MGSFTHNDTDNDNDANGNQHFPTMQFWIIVGRFVMVFKPGYAHWYNHKFTNAQQRCRRKGPRRFVKNSATGRLSIAPQVHRSTLPRDRVLRDERLADDVSHSLQKITIFLAYRGALCNISGWDGDCPTTQRSQ